MAYSLVIHILFPIHFISMMYFCMQAILQKECKNLNRGYMCNLLHAIIACNLLHAINCMQ